MPKAETELQQNYAGAFDGHLAFGNRPALLIVDFVMAYLDPASPLYAGVEDALASNERLLAAARAEGRTDAEAFLRAYIFAAKESEAGWFPGGKGWSREERYRHRGTGSRACGSGRGS